jgi:hypothetical protein
MKKDGLSLRQIEAAELLATSNNTEVDIAEMVGISINTLRAWKSDIKFKVYVFQLFEQRLEYERNTRIKKMAKYLRPVYNAIRKKMEDATVIRSLSLRDLMKIMAQLHYEIRQDKIIFKGASVREEKKETGRVEIEGGAEEDGSELDDMDAVAEAKKLYLAGRRAASNKVVPIQRAKE